ncbi:MAG: hypothetical protein AB1560_00860 [Pseudomonadota bacterium]
MRDTQMNRLLIVLLLTMLPIRSWAIDEMAAREIAEKEAGCSSAQPCQTRARLDKDRWVMVVWFIHGYRENGEPVLKPGGWVGITVSQDGKITEKVPGA